MTSIIIADDDGDLVDTYSDLLKNRGFQVVGIAYDGDTASKLYSIHKPDVVLLDLNMPNFDGHYAIEKIKQSKLYI